MNPCYNHSSPPGHRNRPSAKSVRTAVLAALALAAVVPASASATYGGKRGTVAFEGFSDSSCKTNPNQTDCLFRDLTLFKNGKRTVLQRGLEPSYSKGGGRLVYVDSRVDGEDPGDDSIVIANPNGTGAKRLTSDSDGHNDSSPSVSPKGTTVVFQRAGALFTVKVDGSGLKLLLSDAEEPSWGTDGRIAFVRGGDIYVAHGDGTGAKRVTKAKAYDASPDWSPKQTKLLFVRVSNDPGLHQGDLQVMNSNGTKRKQINKSNKWFREPVWSPDGKRIAFSVDERVRVANPDGSKGKTIAAGYGPAWRPNG